SAPVTPGFAGALAFSGITTLVGRDPSHGDVLQGAFSDATTWTLQSLATGSGTVQSTDDGVTATEIAFQGINALVGGLGTPGDNTLLLSQSATLTVSGIGAGTVAAGGNKVTFSGFDQVTASGGVSTLAGP